MSSIDECFERRNLKKTNPSVQKAKASLTIAENNLKDAKTHLDNNMYNWALIASYASMFHSGRALLFKDGVKEKSHFCLAIYVKEKYKGIIESKYLNELNILREQRHMIFYGDEEMNVKEAQEVEADSAVNLAEGFLDSVKKIIQG